MGLIQPNENIHCEFKVFNREGGLEFDFTFNTKHEDDKCYLNLRSQDMNNERIQIVINNIAKAEQLSDSLIRTFDLTKWHDVIVHVEGHQKMFLKITAFSVKDSDTFYKNSRLVINTELDESKLCKLTWNGKGDKQT